MKTIAASVIAAAGASACCLGPVVLSALGAGAFGAAAAVKLEPLRPVFLTITTVLLGVGFFFTYRRDSADQCAVGGSCAPSSKRAAKVVLWLAVIAVILLVTFPYYVNWLV